ncbi:MAG: LysR substrate-binding domain-containing protein, partial [bacterium]|nr:LysR substrate-binding domain-containing protein [bacterium]
GVVGTFAGGWLLERADDFTRLHPHIDLRILTNNNRVDLAGEGLECAIRFGDGAWHGTHADRIMDAPLAILCAPAIAKRIAPSPSALARETLLRSYRSDQWPRWFAAAGIACPPLRGPVFDSSTLMVAAAIAGHGVALAPAAMFDRELRMEQVVAPFALTLSAGAYWLTRLLSREEGPALQAFRTWLLDTAATGGAAPVSARKHNIGTPLASASPHTRLSLGRNDGADRYDE